jgi:prepilin-type N-terminal cleavage/methylation domain-containing protein
MNRRLNALGTELRDRGFTLIEVLVSMIIFSLVIAVAFTALLTIQKQTADTAARDDSVTQSQLGLALMDRLIRSGNVLYDPAAEVALGYPQSMRVFTQANAQEKCVQWQIVSGDLRMRTWSPSWQTDGMVSEWSVKARHLVNDSALPADTPFKLVGAPTAYEPRMVQILLRVQNPKSGGKPIDVTTTLTGRNTIYGYDQDICNPIPPA